MAKKTKTIRKQKDRANKRSPLESVIILIVALGITVLAFVSMELAFLAVGYLGISLFLLIDHKRRQHWESASSFKLQTMSENHDQLAREVTRHRKDILTLKENAARTAVRMDEQDNKAVIMNTTPAKPATTKTGTTKKLKTRSKSFHNLTNKEITHRTLRTKKLNKLKGNTKVIANYELADEHKNLSDIVVTELIHDALQNQNIEVFMQPIVRLPQRKIRAYEVFGRVRARAGVYVPAGRYMDLAHEESVMHDLDHLLLMKCLQTIKKSAHIENATPFFVNVTSDTLKSGLFMRQLLRFVSRNRGLAKRLILEIRQNDFDNMQPGILEILRGLTALGCSLSLDHVYHLNFDVKLLQSMRMRYVKINAATMLKSTHNTNDLRALNKTKRQLGSNGIALIIERIEKEETLRELLDFEAHYGQGHLFGRAELQGVYRQKVAA